jgi:cytochrome P450
VFDPRDPEFLADPYIEYARLREQGEVHVHEGLGLAIAVSHSAASAVLRHRALGRIWSDARPAEQFVSFNLLHRNSLLENEPPVHTRLRSSISAAFNRRHIERMRPTVGKLAQNLADGLVARIAEDGEADLLDHLAQPLPVAVIAELLDIPEADRSRLVPWSNAIVKMYEYGLPEEGRRSAENAATEFSGYLREIAESRREQPGEDLVSGLLRAELTEDEVVATAVLLLMAGAVRALLKKAPTLRTTRKPERKPEFAIRGLRSFPVSA